MRIYIDCTATYSSGIKTGIERVVRNFVKNATTVAPHEGPICQAVIWVSGQYKVVTTTTQDEAQRGKFVSRFAANRAYFSFVGKLAVALPRAWQRFLTGNKHEPSLARLTVYLLKPLIWTVQAVQKTIFRSSDAQPEVQFRKGDLLLLADSVWNYSPWAAVAAAKSAGAHVAAIVYDIIPVTHGQFFAPSSRDKFVTALPLLLLSADTFFCISAYTQAQLHDYYAAQPYAKTLAPKKFCSFTLGAELDTLEAEGQVRTKISLLFGPARPVFLAVGTLEPRKNHAYLLQAFQKLWDAGNNSILLIVGRVGWMCDEVLETIRRHPKLGQLLFFMDDVSDAELDYCYAHARALLFSSIVEGFGLPIIEALRKGLPVFASDIPVFHEVGGEYVVYFDLSDPASLTNILTAYEASGKYLARSSADFTWPDWSQSTATLIAQLAAMHSPQPIP